MNKLKSFSVFFILALVTSFGAQTFAQETRDVKLAEPSYEVLLQVLVASNAPGANIQVPPPALANVVKKLKTTFSFAEYRVAATYINRVENGGTIESKGVIQEASLSSTTPVFQEWTLDAIRKVTDAGGQNVARASVFRFGARIPIQAGGSVAYEYTGLTINRINLVENSPTIIGTLNSPKLGELVVLVLTVRTAN